MTEKYEKIVAVLADPSLRQRVEACGSHEDNVKLLAENGVETTAAEIKDALMYAMKASYGEGDELSEEQLEQIAGGGFWDGLMEFLRGFFHGFI